MSSKQKKVLGRKKKGPKLNQPKKTIQKMARAVKSMQRKQRQEVPAAVVVPMKTTKPKFLPAKDGGTIVRHTEYLFDLFSTPTFSLPVTQVVICQPGLTGSFPWLAQIAANYELYIWKKLRFRFMNRIMTGNSGVVYMAWQNDSEDTIFGSKQEMMAYEGSKSNAYYRNQVYVVNCKKSQYFKKYFVRTTILSSGSDSQLYDFGMFSITSVGKDSTPVYVGDVLVDYEIEFFKPKINPSMGSGYYANWQAHGTTLTTLVQNPLSTGLTNITNVEPYLNYFTVTPNGTSGDYLCFPMVGVYIFAADVNRTGTDYTTTPSLVLTFTSALNLAVIIQKQTQGAPSTGDNNVTTEYVVLNVTKAGNSVANSILVTFAGGSGITNWSADYWVVQINPNALGPAETLGGSHPAVKGKSNSRLLDFKKTSPPSPREPINLCHPDCKLPLQEQLDLGMKVRTAEDLRVHRQALRELKGKVPLVDRPKVSLEDEAWERDGEEEDLEPGAHQLPSMVIRGGRENPQPQEEPRSGSKSRSESKERKRV